MRCVFNQAQNGGPNKAEDSNLGRMVALKFLPPTRNDDRSALERFQIQARAAWHAEFLAALACLHVNT